MLPHSPSPPSPQLRRRLPVSRCPITRHFLSRRAFGSATLSISAGRSKDTKAQTVGALQAIQKALAAQKLTLGDVVMMHVYLVADPANGKMDFAGFMGGYTQFFGTKEQPNKPARSAMQVAALAAPGALVEIEVIAARP